MREAKLGDVWVVRIDPGEAVVEELQRFAAERRIDAASVTGIGALRRAELGFYDAEARDYVRRAVEEPTELAALVGNVSVKEGRAFAHLHATLARRDFSVLAGHFFEGVVGGTCELVIRPLQGYLQRKLDDQTRLFVIDV